MEDQPEYKKVYEWPDLPHYQCEDMSWLNNTKPKQPLKEKTLCELYREELKNVMEVETEINNLIAPINEI